MSEYLDKLKSLQIGPSNSEGYTVQLPKHYPYAKRHKKDGTVAWTTRAEGRDIAKRAQDHGDIIHFDL